MIIKDTYTKRREMNRVATRIRDMDESKRLKELEKKQQAEIEATPEFQLAKKRRILRRNLDMDNRKNPNNRIANTREFMLNTLECIYNEFHALDHELTDTEVVAFMDNYHIHFELIQTFDNEVEFDKEKGCTRDLQLIFLEKLAAIEPKLMNYFIKTDTAETTI